ncbi:MAG: DEAD/DEAH box helicase, partial [Planctomycetota bacterium]
MTLSSFHPAVRRWFQQTLGEPTEPQRRGWPAISRGEHTLIAAPTGSGKTLAAFLHALQQLLSQGAELNDSLQVLYVSPLKALSNDVQKNLQGPLSEIRELDGELPEVRVLVRSGDTTAGDREAMKRRPPHILVTTPESLYILLTSEGGRKMLRTVHTVIVDEIHALVGNKRGAHLSLSLERLEALTGTLQRVGLSATQKPIADISRFLVGAGRECTVIDAGHLRELDLHIEVPSSPLSAVCSHEVWDEIYGRMVELIEEHHTTLIFVNTRKLAERLARRLSERLDENLVACHHSSLSKERRLDAEQRLKAGKLRALVTTASLELGIDIGDVDLVIQISPTRSIATLIQRVGRSGHVLGRTPKGRLFPLTQDELVESVALLRSVHAGELDRIPQPQQPLDILAQQLVAACAAGEWREEELLSCVKKAWPYYELSQEDFNRVVEMHTQGRKALLHRDGVGGRLLGTRRARLTSITSGGAIPDNADYQVILEPDGTRIGTLNEDFVIEASSGDIFQLGNASWQILRVQQGVVRVADARGAPPTIPFWFGEAPARTVELSDAVSLIYEELQESAGEEHPGVPVAAAEQVREYLHSARQALGVLPSRRRIILERFFDESGGMQLVVHSPLGSRINRAWGLALRKRFCRHFGFELQAAATDQAILLSLGPQHSFPLEEVFDYLKPESARNVLVQALLATPLFSTRWRWNVTRALLVERMRGGQRVPAPLLRFRADDLLAETFPQVVACFENLPPGDLPVPEDHPMIRQTIEDCLTDAMDLEGFIQLLKDLREGRIERLAVDTPQPSPLAIPILAAQPYSFLDDA